MKKVIRFTADWCPGCKKLSNLFENYTPPMPVEVYDYDRTPDVFVKYKIKEIPTMLMFEDDIIIKRTTGAKTVEELNEWFTT